MATPEERFNQLAGENQQLAAALTSLQAQFSQQAAVQTQLSQLTQALSGLPRRWRRREEIKGDEP